MSQVFAVNVLTMQNSSK